MSGRIITFYSWKGGVGRTMALANAGVQLARRGKRVLLVDWDLEAPGLERYFRSSSQATPSALTTRQPPDNTGLLGLLTEAAEQASPDLLPEAWLRRLLQVELLPPSPRRTDSVAPAPTTLHLLQSGIGTSDYAVRLQAFSWTSFFENKSGGGWLEGLRDQWRDAFDVVLIDSRTGLSDSGGVCTVQMPDTLVLVFTANTQSLEDGLTFLNGVQRTRADFAFERAPLTVIPLLARWEGDKEVDLADSWLERMESVIAPLVESWLPEDVPVRRMLERLRVPHVARFSFGEPLPVLTHSLSDPDRPGLAYDLLAELLASGFGDAGRIIEPGYRPAFDPFRATDAEFDALVLDDEVRETAIARVAKTSGENSPTMGAFLLRLAESSRRIGRIGLADRLAQQAVLQCRFLAEQGNSMGDWMLSRALHQLGEVREASGSLADAKLAFGESLTLMRRLISADPSNARWQRDFIVSQVGIGDVLRDQGDLSGALMAYRESLSVSLRLAQVDPSNEDLQENLCVIQERNGDVLCAQGDLAGALNAYRESLVVRRRLAEADPSNGGRQRALSVTQNKVGDVLNEQGDVTAALREYRATLALRKRLADSDPSNAGWQRDLSVSLDRNGDVLYEQGDLAEALMAYRQSLEVRKQLVEADPSNAHWQRDLGVSNGKLGDVLRAQGDLAGALAAYRESLEVRKRLAAADPSNARSQRDLSLSHMKVGDMLRAHGDLAGALLAYQESLTVNRRLAGADPSNAGWQRDLSVTLTYLAELHAQRGESAVGLSLAEESLSIDERLSKLDPTNVTWQRDVAVTRELVARLRIGEGP